MNAWNVVRDFENVVAEYAGAPFGIAVDNCTWAIFLCLKYFGIGNPKGIGTVNLPRRTYCSVPGAVIHAGGKVNLADRGWRGSYDLFPYPIIDSACHFQKGMVQFRPEFFWCLSFQARKHLPIGRGGMILTSSEKAAEWLRLARFNGRREEPMSQESKPAFVGWHCFMEPERAARGLQLMMNVKDDNPDLIFDYPDLSKWGIYS